MSEAAPERELPPALILAELERITSCAQFRRAGLLQRMLSHLVRTSLAGETSRLREFNLALDCFRRSASRFDPHSDSGVRVAANRIRQKLAAWYANEGADSGIRIDLPVGTYVPTFARQDPRHEPAAAARGTGRRSHFPTTAEVRDLYDRFKRCPGCDRVYWEGTHFDRMRGVLERLQREFSDFQRTHIPQSR